MSIQSTIKEEMKKAMIAKNATALLVTRGLIAEFGKESIAKNVPELSDEDALALIRRAVKQRKDSIDQFTKGGRQDLVESEQAELTILEAYLPAMMSREDVVKAVTAKKEALGITDKAKIGQLVGALMKDLKGKADGTMVKEVAEGLF
jgi:uncharacterized protein YqeY